MDVRRATDVPVTVEHEGTCHSYFMFDKESVRAETMGTYLEFVGEFDLPGINENSLDLDIERNVVTVRAERPDVDPGREMLATERPRGVFSRQLVLGENLDTDKIAASYDGGVLRLRIPVAEKAKPRKIAIGRSNGRQVINA